MNYCCLIVLQKIPVIEEGKVRLKERRILRWNGSKREKEREGCLIQKSRDSFLECTLMCWNETWIETIISPLSLFNPYLHPLLNQESWLQFTFYWIVRHNDCYNGICFVTLKFLNDVSSVETCSEKREKVREKRENKVWSG